MAKLEIELFSCIKYADLEVSPVNVIIGPQGSGKSVTTKVLYFVTDILSGFHNHAERGDTLDDFKKGLAKQFNVWFPPSAWGNGRFAINYTNENFTVRILRRISKGSPAEEVAFSFSSWFDDIYNFSVTAYSKAREDHKKSGDLNREFVAGFESAYRAKSFIIEKIESGMNGEYVRNQIFIPAGRAFFTSIGRLVAGIEQAGNLDPLTIKFAKLFANLRDRGNVLPINAAQGVGEDYLNNRRSFMARLFDGEIKNSNDSEYLETKDGRKIPFTSLSSGQQELLPMWTLIDYLGQYDILMNGNSRRNSSDKKSCEYIYIEEPEAHLFPSAQSVLLEFLIGYFLAARTRRKLILTTHSPYVMSKLNVFLKAGQLARRKKRNQDINEIVPRECWLTDTELSASALNNGRLIDLSDEDGLIDGTYLDAISEEISRQFSKLLEIESEI